MADGFWRTASPKSASARSFLPVRQYANARCSRANSSFGLLWIAAPRTYRRPVIALAIREKAHPVQRHPVFRIDVQGRFEISLSAGMVTHPVVADATIAQCPRIARVARERRIVI